MGIDLGGKSKTTTTTTPPPTTTTTTTPISGCSKHQNLMEGQTFLQHSFFQKSQINFKRMKPQISQAKSSRQHLFCGYI